MSDEEGPPRADEPGGPDRAADPAGADGTGPEGRRAGADATGPDDPADAGGPAGGRGPGREPASAAPEEPTGPREWVRWFRTTDREAVVYVRELATSVGAVLAIGLLLFLVSGVWPPMVAVESASMEPNMRVGDLVFVMEEDRLSPEYAHETGVVSHRVGQQQGYSKFGAPGDVIIYRANGQGGTPIIHRAMFWVEAGENWCDKANPRYISDRSDCAEAAHSGFITKGDNARTNGEYDQVNGLSSPVKPAWIVGTAELSVPALGYVKLCTSSYPYGTNPCPVRNQFGASPGGFASGDGPAGPVGVGGPGGENGPVGAAGTGGVTGHGGEDARAGSPVVLVPDGAGPMTPALAPSPETAAVG